MTPPPRRPNRGVYSTRRVARLRNAPNQWADAAVGAWVLALLFLTTGCLTQSVTRSVEGRYLEGRAISVNAYMQYAYAADAEAHGHLQQALVSYEAALEDDEGSVEILARIFAVRCKLGDPQAEAVFERGLAVSDDYEPLWRERAKCELSREELDSALEAVLRATALDPNRIETTILHANILERLNREAEAWETLYALTIRHPLSAPAWRERMGLAARMDNVGERVRAARVLRRLVPREASVLASNNESLTARAELDEALRRGDLSAARDAANRGRFAIADVAARAMALGHPTIAREQARRVLRADPANGSARVVLAAAATQLGDGDELTRAMSMAGVEETLPPHPLAAWVFAEALLRAAGPDAARAWLEGWRQMGPAEPEAADGLLHEVQKRVNSGLGAPLGRPPA